MLQALLSSLSSLLVLEQHEIIVVYYETIKRELIRITEPFPSDDKEDRNPDPVKENERSLMLEEAILSLGAWC